MCVRGREVNMNEADLVLKENVESGVYVSADSANALFNYSSPEPMP